MTLTEKRRVFRSSLFVLAIVCSTCASDRLVHADLDSTFAARVMNFMILNQDSESTEAETIQPSAVDSATDESKAPTAIQPSRSLAESELPPSRRLLAEGTFVISRRARISHAGSTRAWIVEFANEPGSSVLPPMLLMPSQRLQRLESVLEDLEHEPLSLEVILSGETYVYSKRNFLMLTSMPRLVAKSSDSDSSSGSDEQSSEPEGPTTEAERMIRELEEDSLVLPILQPANADIESPLNHGDEVGDEQRKDRQTHSEGTYIFQRSARLIRSGIGGPWTVVFESDDGGESEDAPLIVLPCQLLETLRKRAGQRGDGFRFLISGNIYRYHHTSYLLPTVTQIPYERANLSP